MNRMLSLAVAGVVSAALVSAGCENKDNKHTDHHHKHANSSDLTITPAKPAAPAGEKPADVGTVTTSDTANATLKAVDAKVRAVSADADATVAAALNAAAVASARAEVEPSKAPGQDDVKGVVEFTAADKGVMVHYDIKGLTPGDHGFHIHEKGDLSEPELKSAGPHFNPGGHKHGGPDGDARHGGDLGNIKADEKGVAKGKVLAPGLTLDESATGIIGRSILVHEKADDLKTDPGGDSGPRIAAGVIKASAAAAK